jgi:hypothetical protein
MTAEVIDRWRDPAGNEWVRLRFGEYRDGTPIVQRVPANVVELEGER